MSGIAATFDLRRAALAAALALAAAPAAFAQITPPPPPATSPAAKLPAKPPASRRAKPAAKTSPDEAEDVKADREDEAHAVEGLTVTAQPKAQYGAVVGDIKPEIQMSPAEIQSYGVSTVTELLNEISPQTRSDRGRGQSAPVVLLNGRRSASLLAQRGDEHPHRGDPAGSTCCPRKSPLKYGYSADQRVVNIVLKRRFRAVTAEGVGGTTTDGGDPTGQAEIDQFSVRRDVRTNFDLKYQVAGGLTDAQRDLAEPSSGAPFDVTGNVVSPTTGGEIDPTLSALVGHPVAIAGVPRPALPLPAMPRPWRTSSPPPASPTSPTPPPTTAWFPPPRASPPTRCWPARCRWGSTPRSTPPSLARPARRCRACRVSA